MTEFELHSSATAETAEEYSKMIDDWAIPLIKRHVPSIDDWLLVRPVDYDKVFRVCALHGITTECVVGAKIIGQPNVVTYRLYRNGLILSELKISLNFE